MDIRLVFGTMLLASGMTCKTNWAERNFNDLANDSFGCVFTFIRSEEVDRKEGKREYAARSLLESTYCSYVSTPKFLLILIIFVLVLISVMAELCELNCPLQKETSVGKETSLTERMMKKEWNKRRSGRDFQCGCQSIEWWLTLACKHRPIHWPKCVSALVLPWLPTICHTRQYKPLHSPACSSTFHCVYCTFSNQPTHSNHACQYEDLSPFLLPLFGRRDVYLEDTPEIWAQDMSVWHV